MFLFFSKKLKINIRLTPASPERRGGGEAKEWLEGKDICYFFHEVACSLKLYYFY